MTTDTQGPTFRRREFGEPAPLTPRPMSASTSVVNQVMLPNDANPLGNVHGGSIMKLVDIGTSVAAMRHCGRQVVTVALDHMSFLAPVYIGDLVSITSCVEYAGRSSMLVRAEVQAENPASGRKVHTSSCILTFVALGDDGRPVQVPPIQPETPEEEERFRAAEALYKRAKDERTTLHGPK